MSGLDEAGLARAAHLLASRDDDLAAVVRLHGIPPLWAREPGFPTVLKTILEQQVSLASAQAVYERLFARVGDLTPQAFLELDDLALRTIGFSRQKTRYGRLLAGAIEDGRFDLTGLANLDDGAARTALMTVKGIGPWTADTYLLMALRRPDVWPAGDIALQAAVQDVKGLTMRPTPEELIDLGEPWRPWRAVAARILWFHYLGGRR